MSGVGGIGNAGSVQQILAMRQQIVDRSQLLQQLQQPASAEPQAPVGAAGGFGAALQGALEQVNQVQARSSAMTEAYEKGEVTDIAKVMLARQEAGIAFEATLQVRNRLLSAYQDIMRMGV
ncbi:MAG: flagellar hook-basal body complex protein FliE [Sphingomonadaceae bacterium]|nr:flagellar hook-basal body complex protein FliE [Sphingomonadaceae bacterium]